MKVPKLPRSEFTASEIEIITGINVEKQKAWRKQIAEGDLHPLGKLRGHWRYGWKDLCLLKLVEVIKDCGLTVDNALAFVLRQAGDDFRDEVGRTVDLVIAAYLVGFEMERDVLLYIPVEQTGSSMRGVMPVEYDGHRPVKGGVLDTAEVFASNPGCVRLAVVNLSRLVTDIVRHADRMTPVLDDLDAHRAVLRGA